MATAVRVTRVANPRRVRSAAARTRRTNPTKGARRKLSPKQIRFFGTKAQKAGLKRRRSAKASRSTSTAKRTATKRRSTTARKRNSTVVIIRGRKRTAGASTSMPNPRRRRRIKRAVRRSSNPALIVTLGNPHKEKKTMARKRSTRRRTTRARRRTRRANPVVVVRRRRRNASTGVRRRRRTTRRNPVATTRRRRRVGTTRRKRSYSRRRNPGGQLMSMATAGLGVVAGVFATKMVQRFIPANLIPSTGGFLTAAAVTGASAYVAYMISQRVAPRYAPWVLAGGMAQTFSVVLNGLMPGFSVNGVPLGISGYGRGMGELMPGRYPVPQNPISAANGRVNPSGLARAYGGAY